MSNSAIIKILEEQDPLSGVYRREAIFNILDELLMSNCNTNPVVLLIEVHRFKKINDGLGTELGDKLIRSIARRLEKAAPSDAFVGRMGGDGFAIVLRTEKEFESFVNYLLDMAKRPFSIGGNVIVIDLSIGVAIGNRHGFNAKELIRAADIALHEIRDSNIRIKQFELEMLKSAESSHLLENDLRYALTIEKPELLKAITTEQFTVNYQPQISLKNGAVVGVEALIRWYSPGRGMVPPDKFIPLAEEMAMINLLGSWVLKKSCKDIQELRQDPRFKNIRLSVNVSPKQLESLGDFSAQIKAALSQSGLPANALILEITENTVLNTNGLEVSNIIKQGCSLALDDFGTGYSSLNVLRNLPFESAKLDKVFVSNLFEQEFSLDEKDQCMIKAFQRMCDELKIETTIEGVEKKEHVDFLSEVGCHNLQGFYYTRPLPFEKLKLYLEAYEEE